MSNTNYVSTHTGSEIDAAVDKVMEGTTRVYNIQMTFDSYVDDFSNETIVKTYNIYFTLFSNGDINITKDNVMEHLRNAENVEVLHRNTIMSIVSGYFLQSSGTILTYGYEINIGEGTVSGISAVTNPIEATYFNVVKVG